jgi:geranylgeranyl diphosphate synthase type II
LPFSSSDPADAQGADLGRPNNPSVAVAPDAATIEQAMGDLLPAIEQALQLACRFGTGCPVRLGDAIRYAVLAPGKRLRPALVLMAAEACGGSVSDAMPGAVAVEMIHAYSLIHDDLPAMDDDDLRRGRPTVHLQFDEATAILAGDALQPLAVRHLCDHVTDPRKVAEAVRVLVTAAGPEQLVGGQADDLAAESGQLPEALMLSINGTNEHSRTSHRTGVNREALAFLESIHRRKTGALFSASLELGAVLCGATDRQREDLATFAGDLGLAFQVVDDLLDHTADENALGKRVGKDVDRGKLTYPGLLGIEGARGLAVDLIASAKGRTAVLGPAAWRLNQLADYVLQRSH